MHGVQAARDAAPGSSRSALARLITSIAVLLDVRLELARPASALRCRRSPRSSRCPSCRAPGRRSARRRCRCGSPCARCRSPPRRRPGRRRSTSTSNGALPASFARRRGRGAGVELGEDLGQLHLAAGEHLAVQEHRRHRQHAALARLRLWNAPPSISVAVTRGFSSAISVSACTTSGQLWHESEKYISNAKSPSSRAICSSTSGSAPWADGRRPTAARAPAR